MPRIATPAVLLAVSLAAPLLAGCNACSSDKQGISDAERERRRNTDPLAKVRKAPKKKIDRKAMKAAKAKMRAEGKSRVVQLSVEELPVDEREVAAEVGAARDLILSGEEAKVTEGRVALDTWIASNPDDVDAYYWRGRSWSATLDFATALADYSAAATKAPDWVQAHRWTALAAFQSEGCDAALPALEKVVELAPEQAESYADRGQCRTSTRDLEGGVADLTKACELGSELACTKKERVQRRLDRRKARKAGGGPGAGMRAGGDEGAAPDAPEAPAEGVEGGEEGAGTGAE